MGQVQPSTASILPVVDSLTRRCRPHVMGIANGAGRAVLFHNTRNGFKQLQGQAIKRALLVNDIDEPTRGTNRTVQIYITIYSGKETDPYIPTLPLSPHGSRGQITPVHEHGRIDRGRDVRRCGFWLLLLLLQDSSGCQSGHGGRRVHSTLLAGPLVLEWLTDATHHPVHHPIVDALHLRGSTCELLRHRARIEPVCCRPTASRSRHTAEILLMIKSLSRHLAMLWRLYHLLRLLHEWAYVPHGGLLSE